MRQTRPRAKRLDSAVNRPAHPRPDRRPPCIRPARTRPAHRQWLLLIVLAAGSALGVALGAISDALHWPPIVANGSALAIVAALTVVIVRYVVPPHQR